MKLRPLLTTGMMGLGALGGAMLVYGSLVESKRLKLEKFTLRLPDWPEAKKGYRIAVLGDFHLRDAASIELAEDAVAMALDEDPDMVVLVGDLIGRWRPESPWMIGEVLGPMLAMDGKVVAIPGNHEYVGGNADLMEDILDELNITTLRNESWSCDGITWIGVDSLNAGEADVVHAFRDAEGCPLGEPRVVLWHEPDSVDLVPPGALLQISGHSHGGQFKIGEWAPMTSQNGRHYLEGYFPTAPTPLFVTRGVGTTGPPSRFNCTPQVAILTLVPAEPVGLPSAAELAHV